MGNDEIPESVLQGERRAQDEEYRLLEGISDRLKTGLSQSEGKETTDQRDAESRIVFDYAKENNF